MNSLEAKSVPKNWSKAGKASAEANARQAAKREAIALKAAHALLAREPSRYWRSTKRGGLWIGALADDVLRDWPAEEEIDQMSRRALCILLSGANLEA